MRVLSSSFLAERKKDYNTPVYLYEFWWKTKCTDEEIGVGDGVNRIFYTSNKPVVVNTEIIKCEGKVKHDYDFDWETGKLTFREEIVRSGDPYDVRVPGYTPPVGATVYATYLYEKLETLTSFPRRFTFNGKDYNPFPISHSSISQSTRAGGEALDISLGNADLAISSKILANLENVRGSRVVIRQVFDITGDQTDHPTWTMFIDSVVIQEQQVILSCVGRCDVVEVEVPKRTLSEKCPWRFNDKNCRYHTDREAVPAPEVDDTFCPKTWEACLERNNSRRYGGFDIYARE